MLAKGLLVSLASLSLIKAEETVLGIYIFHRHGDRTPKSHAPTNLTSLGAEQTFSSGKYYRNRYVASDASSPVFGLSPDIAVAHQMAVTAPVDTVLQNSAQVFLQGLYPPAGSLSAQTLANGSTVEGPLGGYQYVPVNAVATAASSTNSENNEWLQGGSGCGRAMVSSNGYFASREYAETLEATRGFYRDLLPVISGTFAPEQATFRNAYTIFDLVNVATVHNASIPAAERLTAGVLAELRALANLHQWHLAYNASEPIRAVAGSVLAAQVVRQLNATLAGRGAAAPLGVQFGAYASFSSFFGLARLPAASPDFEGIVDYASSMVFELVANASAASVAAEYPDADDVSVRFWFANGTAAENEPVAYPLFGLGETTIPWSTFAEEMGKFAIGDTAAWCTACGNTTGICASSAPAGSDGGDGEADNTTTTAAATGGNRISTAVAGVIGALVTLAVVLGLEALVYALAGLRLVKKSALAGAGARGGEAAGAKA